MVPGQYLRRLALAWLALGALPAHGIIIQGGGGPEADAALEKASHGAGAAYPSLAAIYLFGRDHWPPLASATGVYLGPSRDGRKGLVLTSAHSFLHDPARPRALPYSRVAVTFGPDLTTCHGLVPGSVRRVLIHPDFQRARQSGPESKEPAPGATRADLAIIEFDLAPNAEGLAMAGSVPARLPDGGTDRAQPVMEAEILGYGEFGTHEAMLLPGNVRVHLGHTLVSHGAFEGAPVFMNCALMAQAASERIDAGDKDPHLFSRFQVGAPELELPILLDGKPQAIRTHRQHALPAHGDSGGPLLFRAPDGPVVAGISSRAETFAFLGLGPGGGKKVRVIASFWEPVALHLPWITRVRDGLADAPALEPGKDRWRYPGESAEAATVPGSLPCVIL